MRARRDPAAFVDEICLDWYVVKSNSYRPALFFGSRPGSVAAPGGKHENLGLGSSSAQLRIDNDFSL